MDQNSKRILIVEDDYTLRKLLVEILGTTGYQVVEADNGLNAMLYCRNELLPIDLIISDYLMPIMNGEQFIKELRLINRDIPVILFTASRIGKDTVKSWGVSYLLEKPCDLNEITTCVDMALNSIRIPDPHKIYNPRKMI